LSLEISSENYELKFSKEFVKTFAKPLKRKNEKNLISRFEGKISFQDFAKV